MRAEAIRRIAVIGNGGGGKTTLARRLSDIHSLPVTHVDSVQFIAGMNVRAVGETSDILNATADAKDWIIDGFGSLEVMARRFRLADRVVFVDMPLWRHYLWATKRQIQSIWSPRAELPENCDEANLRRTLWLYRTLWRVHSKIRPQLIALFEEPAIKPKVTRIGNLRAWNSVYKNGLV